MTEANILFESRDNLDGRRLPLIGLTILSMAAFITLLTEIMPAGLLSGISKGLRVTESASGQFITAFAVGALLCALPLTALTRTKPRKPLLLTGIAGLALVDIVTGFSTNYYFTLVIRFFSGAFGGLIWSLIVGYAVKLSPLELRGRAIAMAGSGVTLALIFGAPFSTFLGIIFGWQGAFFFVGGCATLLFIGAQTVLPEAVSLPGEGKDLHLVEVFRKPGISATLFLIFFFIAAHSILYIYIEPLLRLSGLEKSIDLLMLLFGLGSVVGLVSVGALIDKHLPRLGLVGIPIFLLSVGLLSLGKYSQGATLIGLFFWGFSFGGFGPFSQSLSVKASDGAMDAAQAMSTTSWNSAVSTGGFIGGVLLTYTRTESLTWMALLFLFIAFLIFARGLRPLLFLKPKV